MGFQSLAPHGGQIFPMGSANAGNAPQASFDYPLARQSSIYSLTLQEFQNVLGEPGKNFDSMNMDELLKNIWTAEESLAIAAGIGDGGLVNDVNLSKQGSLTLPRTLSRKTVEEVWKGIQQELVEVTNSDGPPQREITFGDMTLEDFLSKAGVVREEAAYCKPFTALAGNFEMIYGNASGKDDILNANNFATFGNRIQVTEKHNAGIVDAPMLLLSPFKVLSNPTEADARKKEVVDNISAAAQQANWSNNVCRTTIGQQQQQQQQQQQKQQAAAEAVCGTPSIEVGIGGKLGVLPSPVASRMGTNLNEGMVDIGLRSPVVSLIGTNLNDRVVDIGPRGATQLIGSGFRPSSSHSIRSDDAGVGYVDFPLSPGNEYGLNGRPPGRKRGAEGNIDKAIERRQRRMIKNRESAARSRARKQAYTVELEAEVSQLKEENMKLRKKQEEEAEKKKKQIMSLQLRCNRQFGFQEGPLRRTHTGPW